MHFILEQVEVSIKEYELQNDPLTELRDIHLPATISWWPPAIGWWLLSVIFAAILAFFLNRLIKNYRRNLYRRQALMALKTLEEDQAQNQNIKLVAVVEILKKTCASAYKNSNINSKSIKEFLSILRKESRDRLFLEIPENIELMVYASHKVNIDPIWLGNFLEDSKKWISSHSSNYLRE